MSDNWKYFSALTTVSLQYPPSLSRFHKLGFLGMSPIILGVPPRKIKSLRNTNTEYVNTRYQQNVQYLAFDLVAYIVTTGLRKVKQAP